MMAKRHIWVKVLWPVMPVVWLLLVVLAPFALLCELMWLVSDKHLDMRCMARKAKKVKH